MNLAVFGASGFLGRVICEAALARGHAVRALVRTPEKMGSLLEEIDCIRGDYFDPENLDKTVLGCDAVISTVGPPLGRRAEAVVGKHVEAMAALMAAMEASGINRIVAVAGAGCVLPGERAPLKRRLMRRVLRIAGGPNYAEKEAEHAALVACELEWVIARPPMIATDVPGNLHVDPWDLAGFKVDVNQLAHFMLDSLTEDTWVRRAPFVSTA